MSRHGELNFVPPLCCRDNFLRWLCPPLLSAIGSCLLFSSLSLSSHRSPPGRLRIAEGEVGMVPCCMGGDADPLRPGFCRCERRLPSSDFFAGTRWYSTPSFASLSATSLAQTSTAFTNDPSLFVAFLRARSALVKCAGIHPTRCPSSPSK